MSTPSSAYCHCLCASIFFRVMLQPNSCTVTASTTLRAHRPLIPLLRPLRSNQLHPKPANRLRAIPRRAASATTPSTIRSMTTLRSMTATRSPRITRIIPSGIPFASRSIAAATPSLLRHRRSRSHRHDHHHRQRLLLRLRPKPWCRCPRYSTRTRTSLNSANPITADTLSPSMHSMPTRCRWPISMTFLLISSRSTTANQMPTDHPLHPLRPQRPNPNRARRQNPNRSDRTKHAVTRWRPRWRPQSL